MARLPKLINKSNRGLLHQGASGELRGERRERSDRGEWRQEETRERREQRVEMRDERGERIEERGAMSEERGERREKRGESCRGSCFM